MAQETRWTEAPDMAQETRVIVVETGWRCDNCLSLYRTSDPEERPPGIYLEPGCLMKVTGSRREILPTTVYLCAKDCLEQWVHRSAVLGEVTDPDEKEQDMDTENLEYEVRGTPKDLPAAAVGNALRQLSESAKRARLAARDAADRAHEARDAADRAHEAQRRNLSELSRLLRNSSATAQEAGRNLSELSRLLRNSSASTQEAGRNLSELSRLLRNTSATTQEAGRNLSELLAFFPRVGDPRSPRVGDLISPALGTAYSRFLAEAPEGTEITVGCATYTRRAEAWEGCYRDGRGVPPWSASPSSLEGSGATFRISALGEDDVEDLA